MENVIRRRTLEVFLYLQTLDVLTTLIGFSLGNTEASPFIGLLVRYGPVAGLAVSKLLAVVLVLVCYRMQRASLIRWINYWYAALIVWNLYTVLVVLNS
jgi:hypothetical protein